MSSADPHILRAPTTRAELGRLARAGYGDMVKAVVDIRRRVMAVSGELHSDEEALLIADGSQQADLWGINLYPQLPTEWVEFDSMINVRPAQGNRSRDVEDSATRDAVLDVVRALVTDA